jgi:SAM-dependent methyltransferase/prefoldin subunit 5
MLEWTGERFLPWLKDAAIAYEHLHRYAFAAGLVKGKRVLDLASGEGYGSKILAGSASSVVGVDIDAETVRHASEKYGADNLRFIPGAITEVPIFEDHSFDAIVCFEAVEHIDDHEKLLREVRRLLRAGGLFVVSTPNKEEYDEDNRFHVKELSIEEFRALLSRSFKHVRLLGQRIHANSSIWPLDAAANGGAQEVVIERCKSEFEFIPNSKRVPLYVIALASDSAESPAQSGSVLVDYSDELLKEKDQAIAQLLESRASQEEALGWLKTQREELQKTMESLEGAVSWREEQIAGLEQAIAALQKTLTWMEEQVAARDEAIRWLRTQVNDLKQTVVSHEEALKWRAQQVDDLSVGLHAVSSELQAVSSELQAVSSELQAVSSELQATKLQLSLAAAQLDAIYASRGWKLILALRKVRDRITGLWNAHVAVCSRALDDFDGAGVVDPVAHLVLIQRAVRHGRREVIETGVQEGQVEHKVHRKPVARRGRRQLHSFIHHIRPGHVLAEPVPKHETDIRLLHVVAKLDGYSNANAIPLSDAVHRVAFPAENPDALDARFRVAVPVIDVGNVTHEPRDLCQSLFR